MYYFMRAFNFSTLFYERDLQKSKLKTRVEREPLKVRKVQ